MTSGMSIRRYDPASDEGYAAVSWTCELARSPTFSALHELDRDLAFRIIRPHVLGHLSDRSFDAAVVHPEGDRCTIVAFIISSAPVLMHLQVKSRFRRLGVAAWLLQEMGFRPTDDRPIVVASDTRALRELISAGKPIVLRSDLLPIASAHDDRRPFNRPAKRAA